MTQRPLFAAPAPERGLARRTDPGTSHAAARSADVTGLEALCLGALRGRPAGLTSEELAATLGRALVSVSPRLRPLVKKGLARDSGRRRRNASNRLAIIWEAGKSRHLP